MYKSLNEIPESLRKSPIYEVLGELTDPGGSDRVKVVFWCRHCEMTHRFIGRSIDHEEYVPRSAPCNYRNGVPPPSMSCLVHRIPGIRMHTQNGITAPVSRVVGWAERNFARFYCAKCCKIHRHYVPKGAEYFLVEEGRCFSRFFAYQEVQREEVNFY